MKRKLLILCVLVMICAAGCDSTKGNVGQMQTYSFSNLEPAWIRNGEPIKFEGAQWYPTDGVENLLDSEVYSVGEYRGVPFFVEKIDIRPYNRLYTKFDKNKFRYFKKREEKKND